MSCNCKCKFDGRKCNSNQKLNKKLGWCKCKNPINIPLNLFLEF